LSGRHEGRPLDLGSPLQCAVLVRLLLAEGRQCGLDDLVDALWEEPPGNAARSVQTYVYRIRLSLGEERSRLETTQGGYRLDIPERAVDALRFERLVRDGEELRSDRRTAPALRAFDAALALWSGEPLSGVPGPYAQRHRRRFAELRLNAQVARLGCADELGEHARVATELISLIADHPLREDLYALRMRALHRAGRTAEALAVYAAARDTMVAELGMDPGPELRELQIRVLAGTEPDPVEPGAAPDTDQVTTAPADEAPAGVHPQQLPPAPGDFVGRERLGERLRPALRPSGEAEEENTVLPLAADHLSVAEWEELGEISLAKLDKKHLLRAFSALMAVATPDEQRTLLTKAPAPARLLWRLSGRRAHARREARLRGGHGG